MRRGTFTSPTGVFIVSAATAVSSRVDDLTVAELELLIMDGSDW